MRIVAFISSEIVNYVTSNIRMMLCHRVRGPSKLQVFLDRLNDSVGTGTFGKRSTSSECIIL